MRYVHAHIDGIAVIWHHEVVVLQQPESLFPTNTAPTAANAAVAVKQSTLRAPVMVVTMTEKTRVKIMMAAILVRGDRMK